VSGSLTYTYSSARGSASSETEDYPAEYKSTRLYPLDWDRTHILNINVNLGWAENEGPDVWGVLPLENTSWNFLLRAGSGYPYTPTGRDIAFVPKNSARIPANVQLDFQLLKEWKIRPITFGIFFEALNLLGTENVRSVYTDTGLPDFTTYGNHSADYMADPSNYYPPRRLRLGARILL
jgi:hypothetical protein